MWQARVLPRPATSRNAWLSTGGGAVVVAAGAGMVLRPPWPFILLGAAAASLAALILLARRHSSSLAVEVPLTLLLLSTLVWRIRTSQDIASDPLDSAGLVRTGLVAIAGLLGVVALLGNRSRPIRHAPGLHLYAAYVLVVIVGAPSSVYPVLTAYRGLELAAGVIVIAGAQRATGNAGGRVEAVLYWFSVCQLASVWVGVLLVPHLAIGHMATPFAPVPWQITGVYPTISANSVGSLGVLVVFWSILRWPARRGRWVPMALFGLASLVAAQYRTGYVALVVGLVVLLIVTRRWRHLAALALLLGCLLTWKPSLVTDLGPYALRGETLEQARGLNSRIGWWEAALPLWHESPLIGRGLLTGTRFEVLSQIGRADTSTIHGTWVEALVGTGLLGCGLLALAYLTALSRAVRQSRRLPLILLVLIGVHTLTGSTIEVFGQASLLLLWATIDAEPTPAVDAEDTDGRPLPGRGADPFRVVPSDRLAKT